MSKLITFNVPSVDGTVAPAEGRIAMLSVGLGNPKHRFVIHDGFKLSDWRSGRLVTCFDHVKIRRMARISHHTKTSDRQAAQIALDEVVDRLGGAKVLEIMAAAPAVNGA